MKNPYLRWSAILLLAIITLAQACHPDPEPPPDNGDLTDIPYNPQPYAIIKPANFPEVPVPADNPMTVAGVQLGRMLFYDPIFSGDSSMACASCHKPGASFTDSLATSAGIDGIFGRRSAMSLINVAYVNTGLFWDGRAPTLEDQAIHPVEDIIELHETWPNVIRKITSHSNYPAMFRKAFGISDRDEITKELVAKALAQFERILISSGNSKYDQFVAGNVDAFDEEELDGKLMFFDEGATSGLPDAQCFHCHFGITLSGTKFFNNGLDSVGSLDEFKDLGRFEVSGVESDKGKFRSVTLRNIALTAPYMHDGRFASLEEAVRQYSDNGFGVVNEDVFIGQIGFPIGNGQYTGLNNYQINALVKFLHTLTDTTFVNNPDIQNPFH